MAASNGWPDLAQRDLRPTVEALHLWCQIAGKVRLSLTPWINHSWHVPLYISAHGLSTGLIHAGPRGFEIAFDLIANAMTIRDTHGREDHVALVAQSVATFYAGTIKALGGLDIAVQLDPMPCELPEAVPFHSDTVMR